MNKQNNFDQIYEADYYVENTNDSYGTVRPTRRPLINSLYQQNPPQTVQEQKEQAAYVKEPVYYDYQVEPEYSEYTEPYRTKAAKKVKKRHGGLFSLVLLVFLSLIFLLLYRKMLPKQNENDSFSLFAKKTSSSTAKLETAQTKKENQLSPTTLNTTANLAPLMTHKLEQATHNKDVSRGGNETFQGAIKLTQEQASRMINLNLEPAEENLQHNLAILGEADQRVKELQEHEDKLAPNMLRLAAKNEAFDFVYKYLQLPEEAKEKQVEAVSQTGASSLGGYKLPAGKVLNAPYYLQWDERWGYKPYAGSVIGTYGCGVTCMASVLGYLTNDATILPDKLALMSEESNTNHGGTDTAFISLAAKKYGFSAVGIPILANNIKAAIDSNKPVVLNVQAGNFTSGGHYIAIVGYTEQGDFIVYDPVSPFHTSQIWSIEILQKQHAQACWMIG